MRPYRPQTKRRRSSRSLMPIAIVIMAVLSMQLFWMRGSEDRFQNPLVSDMLRSIFDSHTLSVGCPNCGGKGLLSTSNGLNQLCPVCFGVGLHHVKTTDEYASFCPDCSGMGRVKDPISGEVNPCPRCGGRGLIKLAPVLLDSNLKPVKILKIECDYCDGKGVVRNAGGMGRLFDATNHLPRQCHRCNGRGLLSNPIIK